MIFSSGKKVSDDTDRDMILFMLHNLQRTLNFDEVEEKKDIFLEMILVCVSNYMYKTCKIRVKDT